MQPWERHYPSGLSARAPRLAADLTTAWRERVARDPDALALLHAGQPTTAAELEARAEGFAGLLKSRGIGPGDRVGILLQNVPTSVVVMLGAWRRGAVVPLLNPMYRGDELRHLINISGARALVVDPELMDVARLAAQGTTVEVDRAEDDPEIRTHQGQPLRPVPRTTDESRCSPSPLGPPVRPRPR